MRASIVRIGNSQGIRIPKVVLEQTQLKGEVELEVRDQQILIRAVRRPRHDWARKFRFMAERGDDRLLDSEAIGLASWDKEEWQWK
ncbi:MAG: AbrB/MazE/SpoVT family DNA-binding domain-containing protein [Deltaproteobacteria bacterium]|nr:AbrB/MazE/SpoVT family DNA-binding domain-containing protein [Deltaproteobacteria bacterium]